MFAKQQQFISYFYWLNPYLAVRDLSMALSASDQKHFFDFEQQAEQHRYNRTQQLNNLHINEVDYHDDRGQRVDASYWEKFPAFVYQKPTLMASLQGVFMAIATPLISLLILLYWFTGATFQRRAIVHA